MLLLCLKYFNSFLQSVESSPSLWTWGQGSSWPMLFLCSSQASYPVLAFLHPVPPPLAKLQTHQGLPAPCRWQAFTPLSSTQKSSPLGLIYLSPPSCPSILTEDWDLLLEDVLCFCLPSDPVFLWWPTSSPLPVRGVGRTDSHVTWEWPMRTSSSYTDIEGGAHDRSFWDQDSVWVNLLDSLLVLFKQVVFSSESLLNSIIKSSPLSKLLILRIVNVMFFWPWEV